MTTMRITVALVVMTAASLACAFQVSTPVMTTTAEPTETVVMTDTPQATDTATWTATVQRAQINVRDEPAGDTVIGYLRAGDQVTIIRCVENWCKIKKPSGWVWRGCLSDNPEGRKCEAK